MTEFGEPWLERWLRGDSVARLYVAVSDPEDPVSPWWVAPVTCRWWRLRRLRLRVLLAWQRWHYRNNGGFPSGWVEIGWTEDTGGETGDGE